MSPYKIGSYKMSSDKMSSGIKQIQPLNNIHFSKRYVCPIKLDLWLLLDTSVYGVENYTQFSE